MLVCGSSSCVASDTGPVGGMVDYYRRLGAPRFFCGVYVQAPEGWVVKDGVHKTPLASGSGPIPDDVMPQLKEISPHEAAMQWRYNARHWAELDPKCDTESERGLDRALLRARTLAVFGFLLIAFGVFFIVRSALDGSVSIISLVLAAIASVFLFWAGVHQFRIARDSVGRIQRYKKSLPLF